MTERTINAERVEQLIDVFGSFDENIRKIEDAFGVRITNRNNELKVSGDEEAADKGCRAIEALLALAAKGEEIDEQKVRYLIKMCIRDSYYCRKDSGDTKTGVLGTQEVPAQTDPAALLETYLQGPEDEALALPFTPGDTLSLIHI